MLKQIEPGTVFGYLKTLEHLGSNKHGQAMYSCKCSCGRIAIVPGYKLRRGEAKSCGCKRTELRLATMAMGENTAQRFEDGQNISTPEAATNG